MLAKGQPQANGKPQLEGTMTDAVKWHGTGRAPVKLGLHWPDAERRHRMSSVDVNL